VEFPVLVLHEEKDVTWLCNKVSHVFRPCMILINLYKHFLTITSHALHFCSVACGWFIWL